jgi:type IV pilus assembly protein PilM
MAAGANWQGRLRRLPSLSLSELSPFKRQESYVAVDIGSSSIKLLEVRTAGHQMEVLNWGSIATPASTIQSNMVIEPARVAESVQALVESRGVHSRKAITAVPGPAVMIKRVTLPEQSEQDLANTIMFEAGNFIPEELENVNLDYQVVGHLDEARQMEVLLVAAKKDIVGSYSETLRAAGLTPVVVDVDYFALDNMYELNYEPTPDRVVALINVGARYSSINILKGGRSMFTGDVPVGGRDITEALTRDLGLSSEDAERAKVGEPVAGVDAEQLSFTLGPALDALIEEIHYALSFFWTAATDERIDAIYVSGGASHTAELAERLAQRAEAPVEVADPFARIAVSPAADEQALRKRGPEFAVATGLASRRPSDK